MRDMVGRDAATCHRGQGTMEYVWLIVTVIAILLAMQMLFKRAAGGRYRSSIDQLSQQHFDPRADYKYEVSTTGGLRREVQGQDELGAAEAGRSFSQMHEKETTTQYLKINKQDIQ